MEFGEIKNKEIREFLRASELLLGLLRQAQEQRCTNYELLLIKAYLERLKGTILSLESLEILTQVRSDRADRADSKSKV